MKISLILRALSGISSIPIDLVRMVDLTDRRAILPVYKPQSSDLSIWGVASGNPPNTQICHLPGARFNILLFPRKDWKSEADFSVNISANSLPMPFVSQKKGWR